MVQMVAEAKKNNPATTNARVITDIKGAPPPGMDTNGPDGIPFTVKPL
jgi:hypothetical protein